MNEELYDILETCLQELDRGAESETILARYPNFAAELRPLLKASIQAKRMSAPAPAREIGLRGRARLMQRVAEMRESKAAPRKRVIPLLQRLAVSFAVTAVFLLSGTGLVSASSTALPGQNLYPVKRNWENVRLFFTFDQSARGLLEEEFKLEREHETNELLFEREEHEVEFSGVLNTVNGATYISSLPVVFAAGLQIPPDGATLEVKGRTTDKGYVEITEFEISNGEDDVPSDENDHEMNSAPSLESSGKNNIESAPSTQPAKESGGSSDAQTSDESSNSEDGGSEPEGD